MAFTQNQINDQFQSQLGRPATDFEVKTYSTASPQKVASLKDTYGKLDQNSLSDYLTYTGQDNSIQSRQDLARKFGISNVFDNQGILTALKAPKSAPQLSGTITQPTTTTPPVQTDANRFVQPGVEQPKPEPQPGGFIVNSDGTVTKTDKSGQPIGSIPGSIAGATNPPIATGGTTDNGQYKPNPLLSTTLSQYQSIQDQIQQIDTALNGELQAKKDQLAKAGVTVSDAQLKSIILNESAPLVNQRKELAAQQGTIGKQYQSLLNADKVAQDAYYKQQNLNQGQQKINQGQEKIDQSQQKLDSSQWKAQKINVLDDNGTKIGEKVIAVNASTGEQRPLTTQQAVASGISIPATTGNSTAAPTAIGGTSKFTFSDFYTNSEAPTKETGNLTDPKTGLTPNAIYKASQEYIATGKMPSIGLGSKPKTIATRDAILNKSGAMLSALGISPSDYQTLYKSAGKAIGNVTDRLARIETVNTTLSTEFPLLKDLANQVDMKSITESDLSSTKAQIDAKFGDTPAARYLELVQSMRAEYGAMIAAIGGGRGGQYAFQSAGEAIPLGYTSDQYDGVQKNLEFISQKNIDSAKKTVSDLLGGLPQLGDKNSDTTSTPKTGKDFVEQTLTSKGLKYDDVIAKYTPTLQQGERLALDNKTGDIIAVTDSDDKNSYTPL